MQRKPLTSGSSKTKSSRDDKDGLYDGNRIIVWLVSVPKDLPPLVLDVIIPSIQRVIDASLRAFHSISMTGVIFPLVDIYSSTDTEIENMLKSNDQLDVIKLRQTRAALVSAIKEAKLSSGSGSVKDNQTARLPEDDKQLYSFMPDRAVDYGDRALAQTDNAIIYTTLWPSIHGMTKPVVAVAPDAKEYVRAFYFRLLSSPNNQLSGMQCLFSQEFVTYATELRVLGAEVYNEMGSPHHISARLAFYSRHIPPEQYMFLRAPFDVKVAVETGRLERAIIRSAVVLIKAFGITELVSHPPVCTPVYIPGWRDVRAHPDAIIENAFMHYEHAAFVIAPCPNYDHVRQWTYYGATSTLRGQDIDAQADAFFDSIDTWTVSCNVSSERLDWNILVSTLKTIRARAAMFNQLTVTSNKIMSVPFSVLDWMECDINMSACSRLILGPFSPLRPVRFMSLQTQTLPLHYVCHDKTPLLGADLNASSLIIFDIDARVAHGQLPPYIEARSRNVIAKGPHVHQVVMSNTGLAQEPGLDSFSLVTVYTDIRYLMTAFFPCEKSSLNPDSKGAAATDQPVAQCKTCMSLAPNLLRSPSINDAFPFCAAGCRHSASIPLLCGSDNGERCSSCAGRYRCGRPRFVIDVNPRDPQTVVRLARHVTMFRLLKCEVTIVVSINVPASEAGGPVNQRDFGVINVAIMHMADPRRYPRIHFVVTGARSTTLAAAAGQCSPSNTLLDKGRESFVHVILDPAETTDLMVRESNDPIWRKMVTPFENRAHAILLSTIMRLQSESPPKVYALSAFIAFVQANDLESRSGVVSPDTTARVVRSIITYFDRVGLIKYCIGTDIVFITVTHFLVITGINPIPEISGPVSEHRDVQRATNKNLQSKFDGKLLTQISLLDDDNYKKCSIRPRITQPPARPTQSNMTAACKAKPEQHAITSPQVPIPLPVIIDNPYHRATSVTLPSSPLRPIKTPSPDSHDRQPKTPLRAANEDAYQTPQRGSTGLVGSNDGGDDDVSSMQEQLLQTRPRYPMQYIDADDEITPDVSSPTVHAYYRNPMHRSQHENETRDKSKNKRKLARSPVPEEEDIPFNFVLPEDEVIDHELRQAASILASIPSSSAESTMSSSSSSSYRGSTQQREDKVADEQQKKKK